MAYRKCAGGWQVRVEMRMRAADKGAAMRAQKMLLSKAAEARRLLREGEKPCCSIGDKLDEFLSDSAAGLGRRRRGYATLKRHRRRLEIFDVAFQRRPLDAIPRAAVERWIKKRLAGGVTADTVKIDLASLYAFARWAQRKGYAPSRLPLQDVEALHVDGNKVAGNQRMPRALDIVDVAKLILRVRAVRPDMALFLQGMVLFGRRPRAMAVATRGDVRVPRAGTAGRIRFRGLKGAPGQEFDIPEGSLRGRWVRECLAAGAINGRAGERAPLVPCLAAAPRNRRRGWTTESFAMAFARLPKAVTRGITPYVVRHSCVTYLQRQSESSLASTQKYAGHSRIDTQNVYSHLVNEEAEKAMALIEKEFAGL